jgi:hypothetical protein
MFSDDLKTVIEEERGRICITQPWPLGGFDDLVVLDHNVQHALYLILKNRFEA